MVGIGAYWKRGLTLIELILAMGIGAIITVAAVSFFFTSQHLYDEGNDQSSVQDSVRMISAFIADDVRNAESIRVVSAEGATGEYIFVSGDQLWRKDGGNPAVALTQEDVNTVSFTLKEQNGRWYLEFRVTGPRGYVVASDVLLNNIDDAVAGTDSVINYNY